MIDLSSTQLQAIARLLSKYPDLDPDQIDAMLGARNGRRARQQPIRPRSWSEITAGVEAGWLTKNEARKLAGLRTRSGPVRRTPVQTRLVVEEIAE